MSVPSEREVKQGGGLEEDIDRVTPLFLISCVTAGHLSTV